MENIDKKEECCGDSCKCGVKCGMGMCGCHGGKCHLVRMILKIFIIVLIFWCGFKLGEATGFIQAEYGRGINKEVNSFRMMPVDNSDYSLPNTAPSDSTSQKPTLTPVKQ